MLNFLVISLLLIQGADTFSLTQSAISKSSKNLLITSKTRLSMSDFSFYVAASRINDAFGIMPLCLQPTSKSTTTDDPMAGMSPEEIQNYLNNVGGGMCGYPEIVRTFIGLGLNLSLIVFGLFTVAYVVVGGANYVLEKKVEDLLKKEESKYPEFKSTANTLQSIQFRGENEDEGFDGSMKPSKNTLAAGEKPIGPNRSERRFKSKLNKNDD